MKEDRKEYAKEYYKKNKKLIKAKRKIRYYENREETLLQQKEYKDNSYRKKDKSERKIIAEYISLHKEEIKELKTKWTKEKNKLYNRIYFQKNKEKLYKKRKERKNEREQ